MKFNLYPEIPALGPDDTLLTWQDSSGLVRQIAKANLRLVTGVATIALLKALSSTLSSNGDKVMVGGYYADADGGGGIFEFNSASAVADNGGTVIAPNAGTGRWIRIVDGPINIRAFGAAGTGATDDSTFITNALNSGYQSFFTDAGTYYLASNGITVPAGVKQFLMTPLSKFTYNGLGAAVTLAANPNSVGRFSFSVQKTVADWDPMTGSGADVTSIGVKVVNNAFSNITIHLSENFSLGVQMLGDGSGCQFNNVFIEDIVNCKVGLQLKKNGGGFTNQNQFFGGSIIISSGHTTRLAGTRYIDIVNGNTNTFYGISLQNDMSEYSLKVADSSNFFLNMRFEANQANAIRFDATATYNMIVGGYFDAGTFSIISDAGGGNYYENAFGFSMDGGNIANAFPISVRNGTTGRTTLRLRRATDGGTLEVGNATDAGGGILTYGGLRQSNTLNRPAGTATCVGGAVTVANTSVAAGSVIVLQRQGAHSAMVMPSIELNPGVGFSLSGDGADNRTYNYMIFYVV